MVKRTTDEGTICDPLDSYGGQVQIHTQIQSQIRGVGMEASYKYKLKYRYRYRYIQIQIQKNMKRAEIWGVGVE